MSLLLGVDIGTTSTKALLLDPQRGPVAEAERPSQLHSALPGWAEEDPDEWWANICALTRELGHADEIAAVGVTGMVPCTILLDSCDRPLRWSVQQNDARAGDEIDELSRRLADARVLERTGSAITQQATGPRFLWFAEYEPELWARTCTVLGSYDYIAMRLTGERAVESNWALESGLFDFRAGSWAEDIVAASGARLDLLPPIRRPEDIVGRITKQAADATGLRSGLPVVAGTADHIGSAFAAGILEDGDVLVKLGGAGDIMLAVDEPLVDERLYLDFHLLPGRYMMSGCMATSGSLIRWFQRVLANGTDLAQLDLEADNVGPGAGGVIALPYFLGEKTPINDPDATGAFVGLKLNHERGNVFRAVLEGIAFGFRHHLDVLVERGHAPRRVRITDGGSKSRVWTQIIADVLGLPLEKVAMRSGSAVAAAFVAGMGVGIFSDWREITGFVEVTEVVASKPNAAYDRNYTAYRALYPALKEVMS
ncbi:MAG: FGGY-family carbohydrate kinase [Acidimicrobiales bacterium]